MSSASTRNASPAPGTTAQVVTELATARQRNPLNAGTLVLRGEPSDGSRSIRWAEDVVDNEGMGKKSSKVCCIYHKSHAVGESSSDESSDSSSDESDSADEGKARMVGAAKGKGRRRKHHHCHDHDHGDGGPEGQGDGEGNAKGKGVRAPRKSSPNAYERVKK